MKTSLRALLFDFDGVLADTEPIHMRFFQKLLKEEGIFLTEEDYSKKYLGLDDRACFEAVFLDFGKSLSTEKRDNLVQEKNKEILSFVGDRPLLLPGVAEFLERVTQKFYMGIVSGAFRSEIEVVLRGGGIEGKFHVIVSADDVSQGKPNPEGFLEAVRLLNRDSVPPSEILIPQECLVIEDSPWGIEAAHAAEMKCLAVMNSYGREELQGADLIVPNLKAVKWEEIEALFSIGPSSA